MSPKSRITTKESYYIDVVSLTPSAGLEVRRGIVGRRREPGSGAWPLGPGPADYAIAASVYVN
jgi:hypothetical protein